MSISIEELHTELSVARTVARIARGAIASERNRHNNEVAQWNKQRKRQETRIARLEKVLKETKDDAIVMFATIEALEARIRIKDGQVAFMKCLVDCMAQEMEDRDIVVPYEELVQRVHDKNRPLNTLKK